MFHIFEKMVIQIKQMHLESPADEPTMPNIYLVLLNNMELHVAKYGLYAETDCRHLPHLALTI